MSINWNPWHGCKKFSEGCENCYVINDDFIEYMLFNFAIAVSF